MMRKRVPTHPGAILREDVLPSLPGMSVTAFARNLGVSRQTLHSVLAERSGVSAEMALRLGKLLGNGAQPERVNDFAAPFVMNLLCKSLAYSG